MQDIAQLPIDTVLPEIQATLTDHRNVVLSALPGAGKTTRVPLALRHEPWLENQRIIMLEPRRLARAGGVDNTRRLPERNLRSVCSACTSYDR